MLTKKHFMPIQRILKKSFLDNSWIIYLTQKHCPVIKFEEKLEYVGPIDELESKTYVLESYIRSFTPIFFRSSELFFIGVFLHGEKIEASQFMAHIKFTNDDYTTFGASQKVKSVDDQEDLGHFFIYCVKQFENSHISNRDRITSQTNFKMNGGTKINVTDDGSPRVDFTLWVTNEKLDEIAKDTKYESGIEDTDDESGAKEDVKKSE